jgi:hypothetical protein
VLKSANLAGKENGDATLAILQKVFGIILWRFQLNYSPQILPNWCRIILIFKVMQKFYKVFLVLFIVFIAINLYAIDWHTDLFLKIT